MKKLVLAAGLAGLLNATPALAETTECTVITSIPTVITVQGIYCLKGNLTTSATSGNMIEIATNNVTIDFNGFKLGGLGGGAGTNAYGVHALARQNIVLRNGSIRGFFIGIHIEQSGGPSSGHLVEDMILDGNRFIGIQAEGTGMIVRNNRVVNTGPSDAINDAYGILVQISSSSLIVGNLVSNTTETFNTYGIYAAVSSLLEIRDNSVLDTDGATSDRGIYLTSTNNTTVIDNRVLNAAGTGTTGIYDINGTGNNCIGNTVAGFVTALSGCDFSAGNNAP